MLVDFTLAVRVGIHSVIRTRRLTVYLYAEPDRRSDGRGPHYKMQIAGVETVDDPAMRSVDTCNLRMVGPSAGESPLV